MFIGGAPTVLLLNTPQLIYSHGENTMRFSFIKAAGRPSLSVPPQWPTPHPQILFQAGIPNLASPIRLILMAAFVSLSIMVWQNSQVQLLGLSVRSAFTVPPTR